MFLIIEMVILVVLAAILLNLERLTESIRPAKKYIREIRERLDRILAERKS